MDYLHWWILVLGYSERSVVLGYHMKYYMDINSTWLLRKISGTWLPHDILLHGQWLLYNGRWLHLHKIISLIWLWIYGSSTSHPIDRVPFVSSTKFRSCHRSSPFVIGSMAQTIYYYHRSSSVPALFIGCDYVIIISSRRSSSVPVCSSGQSLLRSGSSWPSRPCCTVLSPWSVDTPLLLYYCPCPLCDWHFCCNSQLLLLPLPLTPCFVLQKFCPHLHSKPLPYRSNSWHCLCGDLHYRLWLDLLPSLTLYLTLYLTVFTFVFNCIYSVFTNQRALELSWLDFAQCNSCLLYTSPSPRD